MNKQDKQQKHRHRKQHGGYQKERGCRGGGKGGQIHGDGSFDLGGEHTMQYTDDVL